MSNNKSKISEKFLIALNTNDSFLVLYKGEKKEIFDRVSLADSREKFLTSLTTGAWMTNNAYYGKTVYRYRPIEGELKAAIGMGVDISHDASTEKGFLKIKYNNLDQLDFLIDTLKNNYI